MPRNQSRDMEREQPRRPTGNPSLIPPDEDERQAQGGEPEDLDVEENEDEALEDEDESDPISQRP